MNTSEYIFSIFLIFSTFECALFASVSECISFEVLLTQNIENLGFHRDFKWLLEITKPESSIVIENKCKIALQLDMPPGAFVNPDQLADLQRIENLKTFINGTVDVEAIEHEATNHTVYVYIEDEQYNKVSLNLPFHLRYQRAQIMGGFGNVVLPKPSLLVRCSQKDKKLCERTIVSAPCDVDGLKSCRWTNMPYKPLFDVAEVLVPVGDLDHYPIVSIISLSIGCIGCIYILSLLSVFSKSV